MQIAGKAVSRDHEPFIVAEMSGNHNRSLQRALEMVESAARAGVHAVKLQTFTPETMTLDLAQGEFLVPADNELWGGRSLFDLYQEAHTPWDWHKPIFERAEHLGLICFSTPFDETAVDFLEELGCPCYKIASFENVDLPLIRKAAGTGRPLIISTGMATLAEMDEAVRTARECGCKDLVLLKCTSTYPADPTESNLLTIPHMRQLFNCETGLSDHTPGIGAAVASVALGATVIEKHFTLSRVDGGVDAAFSLEPDEMKTLLKETKRAWQALGQVSYGPVGGEKISREFRRSLYITRDMKAGEALDRDNLRRVRPGLGLPPKYYNLLLGRKVNRDVKKGSPVSWDLFE